jgi:membrane protein required for colicin V production
MALAPVDYVVLVILGIALLRGVFRGLLRETFSVAALGAACVAVMLFYGEVAEWLLRVSEGRIGEMLAPYAAGVLISVGTIGVTALLGRFLRRGAKAVGLGWADRTGGALLGAAEGLLIAGILLALAGYVAGRDHPVVADSRSLEVLEDFEEFAESGDWPAQWPQLPSVAAGPPTLEAPSD